MLNVVPVTFGISGLLSSAWLLQYAGPEELELLGCAVLVGWFSLGLLCAGLAILLDLPGFYCKRRDGTLPSIVWLYLGGWLLVYRGWHFFKWMLPTIGLQYKVGDCEFDLVAPRLLLGRLLWELPVREGVPEVGMVIDMTCEWTEPLALRSVREYIAVPVVDTTRPTIEQTASVARRAVRFLRDPHAGSVYVHCANGYGRSAVVVGAMLLMDGSCRTPAEAKEAIVKARPVASLREKRQKSACESITHMEILQAIADRGDAPELETGSLINDTSSDEATSS